MAILGISYITYLTYACMINSGTFVNVINQVAEKALSHSVETECDALHELAETLFEKAQDARDIAE